MLREPKPTFDADQIGIDTLKFGGDVGKFKELPARIWHKAASRLRCLIASMATLNVHVEQVRHLQGGIVPTSAETARTEAHLALPHQFCTLPKSWLSVGSAAMKQANTSHATIPFNVGSYTASEAARLIGTSALNVRRWMLGYKHGPKDARRHSPPLWTSQLSMIEDHLEIGFRDLIELRFVKAFTDAGVGLLAVRNCLNHARECVQDDHPFSTQRFRTDGKTIFLESVVNSHEPKLLDLKSRQYVFRQVFERSFKDLDIEDRAVARWRPYKGKHSIVIDPARSFGQPIAAATGIPTIVLLDAVEAEGSVEHVARLYEIAPSVVRDAVAFERSLAA